MAVERTIKPNTLSDKRRWDWRRGDLCPLEVVYRCDVPFAVSYPNLSAMRRVLGIDPGLRITGYGVVACAAGDLHPRLVEAGVIRLDSAMPLEGRLIQLHGDLVDLITELKPDHMALEKLYAHYRHPRTAILMAHARGVIMLSAQQHGLPIEHLPSTEVKRAVTGYGHASKVQMQRAVQSLCGLAKLPSPPDVADAVGIAMTFARRLTVTG